MKAPRDVVVVDVRGLRLAARFEDDPPYDTTTMADENRQPLHNVAIETSGVLGSVALGRVADILQSVTFSGGLRHAVELLPTIDRFCRAEGVSPGDIGECYVSGGPGSFTGVRIGMTVARTLAMVGRVRVVRVPTLDVIAQNALQLDDPPPNLGVILDARRRRVYAAAFVLRGSRYERTTGPAEVEPARFLAELPRPGALIGEGVRYPAGAVKASGLVVLPERTHRARVEVVHVLGRGLAAAGRFDGPEQLIPIYVRRPEAEEVWERRGREQIDD